MKDFKFHVKKLIAPIYNRSLDLVAFPVAAVANAKKKRGTLHFPFLSEMLSAIPFAFGWKFRLAVYKRLLPECGNDVVLHHRVVIDDVRTTFGNDIWVSIGAYIDYANIEDHVLIGPHAVILSGGRHHNIDRLDLPIKMQGNPPKQAITIGRGAWIGANAVIMADVGHDAIVGAGAVVTKPVEPFAIVGGNPAKLIRSRLSTQ